MPRTKKPKDDDSRWKTLEAEEKARRAALGNQPKEKKKDLEEEMKKEPKMESFAVTREDNTTVDDPSKEPIKPMTYTFNIKMEDMDTPLTMTVDCTNMTSVNPTVLSIAPLGKNEFANTEPVNLQFSYAGDKPAKMVLSLTTDLKKGPLHPIKNFSKFVDHYVWRNDKSSVKMTLGQTFWFVLDSVDGNGNRVPSTTPGISNPPISISKGIGRTELKIKKFPKKEYKSDEPVVLQYTYTGDQPKKMRLFIWDINTNEQKFIKDYDKFIAGDTWTNNASLVRVDPNKKFKFIIYSVDDSGNQMSNSHPGISDEIQITGTGGDIFNLVFIVQPSSKTNRNDSVNLKWDCSDPKPKNIALYVTPVKNDVDEYKQVYGGTYTDTFVGKVQAFSQYPGGTKLWFVLVPMHGGQWLEDQKVFSNRFRVITGAQNQPDIDLVKPITLIKRPDTFEWEIENVATIPESDFTVQLSYSLDEKLYQEIGTTKSKLKGSWIWREDKIPALSAQKAIWIKIYIPELNLERIFPMALDKGGKPGQDKDIELVEPNGPVKAPLTHVSWNLLGVPQGEEVHCLIYGDFKKEKAEHEKTSCKLFYDEGTHDGTFRNYEWKLVPRIKNDAIFYLRIIAQGKNWEVKKTFTFVIKGEGGDDDFNDDLDRIIKIIGRGLALPKRSLFAFGKKRTLNVAQFASETLFSQKSILRDEIVKKIPVVLRKIDVIKGELDRVKYDQINPGNYQKFREIYKEIAKVKRPFLGLANQFDQMKNQATFAFDMLNNDDTFKEMFKKEFRHSLGSHNTQLFYSNPKKVAFMFAHKDTLVSPKGAKSIDFLFNVFDKFYDYLIQLDSDLKKIKTTLTQLKKDLKKT